jgi:membrane protein implicated in regulation of membrane protease activity
MAFLIVGALGVLLLSLSFVLDDVLDGVLPDDGWLSTPVLGAFLTATGFGAWLLDRAGLPAAVALLGGTAAGVVLGWVAFRISRSLLHMATDATPTAGDLVGRPGRVVTPIPAAGIGEILVRMGGQPLKLTARADEAVPNGAEVVVVTVLSPTQVEVQSAARFWGSETKGELR